MKVRELHEYLKEILEKAKNLGIPDDAFHICFEQRGLPIQECKDGYKNIVDIRLNAISFVEQEEYLLTIVLDD